MSKVIKHGECAYVPIKDFKQAFVGNLSPISKKSAFNVLTNTTAASPSKQVEPSVKITQDFLVQIRRDMESRLSQAKAQAEAITKKAEDILDQAKRKTPEIESEAYNQGYAQGQKDGEEFGRRQYEATAQRLNKVIAAIQQRGNELLNKYEAQIVQLAIEVAKCVVQREIQTDPTTIVHCVRAAMEQVIEGSHLHIHLNSGDANMLTDLVQREFRNPGSHPITLVPDSEIEQGGCLIKTEFGLVDATLSSKWQAVTEAISQVLNERTGISFLDPEPDKENTITHDPSPNTHDP